MNQLEIHENIYKKLQVHSKIEAVQKARNHNII